MGNIPDCIGLLRRRRVTYSFIIYSLHTYYALGTLLDFGDIMRIRPSPNLQEGDKRLVISEENRLFSPPAGEKRYGRAVGRALEGPGCYFQ